MYDFCLVEDAFTGEQRLFYLILPMKKLSMGLMWVEEGLFSCFKADELKKFDKGLW